MQDDQLENLNGRLEKVMALADEFGIQEDIRKEENRMRDYAHIEEKATLMRKKKIMIQAHASNMKKIDFQILKERKILKSLDGQHEEFGGVLEDKTQQLKEKTERIAELIEKAKQTSDSKTLSILKKWEVSNQKIIEQFEEDAPTELLSIEEVPEKPTFLTEANLKKGGQKTEVKPGEIGEEV